MKADIVTADDGFFAVYLDGRLEYWGDENPFDVLVDAFEGKTITEFEACQLGGYGISASNYEDPAEWMGDIPSAWWSDDRYADLMDEAS